MYKMCVTVIGPTYPYKGGISHFTTIFVKHLQKTYDVQFLSWKRQYPSFLYPVSLYDEQSKNPIQVSAKFVLDFFNPVTWIQSAFLIKKNQSHVVFFTWASPIQGPIYFVIATILKWISNIKVTFVCHNVLPHEKRVVDSLFTKIAFHTADTFIVHSKADEKILKHITQGRKKIILGFHPIYSVFNNKKRTDVSSLKKKLHLKKRVLLFFGYIRPYKGLLYLLEAMPEIIKHFPDTTLLIVGEFWSKDKKAYIDTIHKLRLEQHVHMVNRYIPNEEVGTYFSLCDVVLLPYTSATQSGIAQIAYAFQKPVIATKVGGLKEIIREGISGYFIKTKNSQDVAKKVAYFFTHWKYSLKFKQFLSQFEWDNYMNTIVSKIA